MKMNVNKVVFNLKIGIKTIFRVLFSKLKVQFSGESAIIKDSTINGNLAKKIINKIH